MKRTNLLPKFYRLVALSILTTSCQIGPNFYNFDPERGVPCRLPLEEELEANLPDNLQAKLHIIECENGKVYLWDDKKEQLWRYDFEEVV